MFATGYGNVFKSILANSHTIYSHRLLHQTHYDVLGLARNCNAKDIREAYIKLSKKYHPDKNTTKSSQKNFVKVLEAYSVLSKADRRRNYDWTLTHGAVRSVDGQESSIYKNATKGYSAGYGYDDPSFWANRDKSGDRYYRNAPYYGVPGINRVSNGIIAFVCIIITIVGVTLQFFAIRHSMTLKREALQKSSIQNEHLLAKLQEEAHRNGNQVQIELLERRFQSNKYYQPPQPKD